MGIIELNENYLKLPFSLNLLYYFSYDSVKIIHLFVKKN